MMYSSVLLLILFLGIIWYLASNRTNNKKLVPILIGVAVVAVLVVAVMPMMGFGMFHGFHGAYGMGGMRCW